MGYPTVDRLVQRRLSCVGMAKRRLTRGKPTTKGRIHMDRREVLTGLSAAAVLATGPSWASDKPRWMSPQLPPGTREEATLQALPGKQKLICLTDRPPNYEAPIETFRTAITPNDQFFVRYHLANIPSVADLGKWSLTVGGDAAEREVTLGL